MKIKIVNLILILSLPAMKLAAQKQAVFPGVSWQYKTPAAAGLKKELLDSLANMLEGRGCIIRNGYIVAEWGDQTETTDWMSAVKPVFSTLLFFGVQDKKLPGVHAQVKHAGWPLSEKDRNMEFFHLANMISGYARPEEPGAAWAYNDYAIQLYQKALFDSVFKQSADEVLFKYLGSLQFEDRIRFRKDKPRLFASVRDFGRIGLFWLNRGNWNGRQLLERKYFDEYMKPQVPPHLPHTQQTHISKADYLEIGTFGGGSDHFIKHGPGIYGFNWWFNARGSMHPDTVSWPAATPNTFMAVGANGNVMAIVPEHDLILVSAQGNWSKLEPGKEKNRFNRYMQLLLAAIDDNLVKTVSNPPVNIIYDSDIGNDVDDILGLSMLYNYARQGKVNLLGVTISKANKYAIPYLRMISHHYKMAHVPIGYVYSGVTPGPGNYLKQTLDELPAGKSFLEKKDPVPEAWQLQRKLLAGQPDGSVVIAVAGFHTNIARLLQSGPDKYSALNGVELVRKKVKLLSVMAGNFYNGKTEYNVRMDIPSAEIIFNQWPGNLVVCDGEAGVSVKYALSSIYEDFTPNSEHPVYVSYKHYKSFPYENPCWDLMSVLEAAEPGAHFTYSKKGRVKVNFDGVTEFIPNAKGLHRYILPLSDTGIARVRLLLQARASGKEAKVDAKTIHPKISLDLFADGINHWSFSNGLAGSKYERYDPSESIFIANNFLAYQNEDGGWLKNVDWLAKLDPAKVRAALPKEKHNASTLDNRNTYAQIAYLCKAYYATGIEKYRAAASRGIDYILKLQNKSGGWRGWDVDAITYNDDVMQGVMELFLNIAEQENEYYWIKAEKRKAINEALQKAIEVTLNAQVVVNGVKTGWCQQHDHTTLQPVKARSYELPSLSPPETASILRFLMRIENPDARIIEAVESGVRWLQKTQLQGLRVQRIPVDKKKHPELPKGYDLQLIKDPGAPPIWARYYEINEQTPFLSTRDGKKVYDLKDVDPERRIGYGWYSSSPQHLLQTVYPAWKKRIISHTKY